MHRLLRKLVIVLVLAGLASFVAGSTANAGTFAPEISELRFNLGGLPPLTLTGRATGTASLDSDCKIFDAQSIWVTTNYTGGTAAFTGVPGINDLFFTFQNLAGDFAPALEAWRHAWLASEEHYGCHFDISLLLQPTTPLRRTEDVERTVRAMVEGGHRAAAAISRLPGHYAPEKIVGLNDEGCLSLYGKQPSAQTARQAFPTYYYRNGICYSATRDAVVRDRDTAERDCVGVLIDEPTANIDDPLELEWAEFLAQRFGERRQ